MKGYEDLVAGLLLLVVVLVGGYMYLDSQVYKQKQVLQVPEKRVELKEQARPKIDLSKFEAAVKRTE
jgi:hypothetical protein